VDIAQQVSNSNRLLYANDGEMAQMATVAVSVHPSSTAIPAAAVDFIFLIGARVYIQSRSIHGTGAYHK
jgi:hypothetical protein